MIDRITVREASARFGLSAIRWRQLAQRGTVPAEKIYGTWTFSPLACAAYVATPAGTGRRKVGRKAKTAGEPAKEK